MTDQPPSAEQRPDPGTTHRCGNCSGIDPDTCLMNPNRPGPDLTVDTDAVEPERADQAFPATPEEAQPASTAPLASGLPLVTGRCPACGWQSLFLALGGYVTCARLECPVPDAASTLLEQQPAVEGAAKPGENPAAPKCSACGDTGACNGGPCPLIPGSGGMPASPDLRQPCGTSRYCLHNGYCHRCQPERSKLRQRVTDALNRLLRAKGYDPADPDVDHAQFDRETAEVVDAIMPVVQPTPLQRPDLRQRYAAAIRQWWDADDRGAEEIADAVMAVRDTELDELRNETAMQRGVIADYRVENTALRNKLAVRDAELGQAADALRRLDHMATAWLERLPDTIRTRVAAEAVHATVRPALTNGGRDSDPIECSHEAALGEAQAELGQARAELARRDAAEAADAAAGSYAGRAERAEALLARERKQHLARADAINRVIALHRPVEDGIGWKGDGEYGCISPACSTCGTDEEYAVPYPCPTIRALDGPQQPAPVLDPDRIADGHIDADATPEADRA